MYLTKNSREELSIGETSDHGCRGSGTVLATRRSQQCQEDPSQKVTGSNLGIGHVFHLKSYSK